MAGLVGVSASRRFASLAILILLVLFLAYFSWQLGSPPEQVRQTVTVTTTQRTGASETLSNASVTRSAAVCRGVLLCFWGLIEHVVDGDTLVIGSFTVRLALVDTPERGQAGYSRAKGFTEALCPVGSQALVDQDDGQPFDRYDRLVGVVYCGGHNLNAELLFAGYATILIRYCAVSEFASEPWARRFGC